MAYSAGRRLQPPVTADAIDIRESELVIEVMRSIRSTGRWIQFLEDLAI